METKVISENLSTVEHLKTFLSYKCQNFEAVQQKKKSKVKMQTSSNSKQRSNNSTTH